MNALSLRIAKERIIEGIKYDFNAFKMPLTWLVYLMAWGLILIRKEYTAYKLVSAIYRTGWGHSYSVGRRFAQYFLANEAILDKLIAEAIDTIEVHENTKKFFDDPLKMLDGIVSVLKASNGDEKGVILLNYSYYFLLFHKYFDLKKINQNYIIILEPSWAGFCELNILAYAKFENPVYIMTYEQRDKKFISELNSSLVPIDIGPSWFVNHEKFVSSGEGERDIDIIMVAGWAQFKRHYAFFKAIAALRSSMPELNITLVGYPTDKTKDEILELANHYGVSDWITIHEWITPSEVAALLERSKINILWSKFEGNNRAIIEGMFCNTPLIMRKGHNYGDHYDFINDATGVFADEASLATAVKTMLENYNNYSPRNYVLNHRSCINATKIMNDVISKKELAKGFPWATDMVVKVNELHSMDYLNSEDKELFHADYKALSNLLRIF